MPSLEDDQKLLGSLKAALPRLEAALKTHNGHWGYEDAVYRFYHQSFKVYGVQAATLEIVELLQALSPDRKLNAWFVKIVREGTGKTFEPEQNDRWLAVTRPIVEAFAHAKYFLEMAVKYGKELQAAPQVMPSGWAAFLYLYNAR